MLKLRLLLFVLVTFIFFSSITLSYKSDSVAKITFVNSDVRQAASFSAAAFYQKQCGFCHTKEELIGPDMNKIKAKYLIKYKDEQSFVNAVYSFALNPDKKNAIYKDGIDNFMNMPKMPFKPEQVKQVAAYIYKTASFK